MTTFIDKSQPPENNDDDAQPPKRNEERASAPAEPAPASLVPAVSAAGALAEAATEPTVIDLASDGARRGPAGINIGGNKVTQSTEHLPEKQKLLVRWLHTHAMNNKWDWATLVEETKLDKTAVFRIWTDTYRYPEFQYKRDKAGLKVQSPHPKARQRIALDGQCAMIAHYKSLYDQRQSVFSAGFIQTSVWEKVEWICKKALIRQKLGFIYGESQIGKTLCLKEFARLNNHGQTIYFEIPPIGGVNVMLRALATALHVNTNCNFDKLLSLVMAALDSSKLLLVDEVHRIFTNFQKTSVMRCLDVLRAIYDKTHCGMVICGTNTVRTQLEQGEFAQYLKQLRRRGLYELQLPEVAPRADLDRFCAAYGLAPASGEAERILLYLAKRDGLGMVCTRLTDAAEYASKQREPLNWKHFISAYAIVRKMALEQKEAA